MRSTLLLVAMLALAGCASRPTTSTTTVTAAPGAWQPTSIALHVAEEAPDRCAKGGTEDHVAHVIFEHGGAKNQLASAWPKDVGEASRRLVAEKLDRLPANATGPSFVGIGLLAAMKRAEEIARQKGRALVDLECLFLAFAPASVVYGIVGERPWTTEDLEVPIGASASSVPTFEVALAKTASAALGDLGHEMATALGWYDDHAPREVARTLTKIRALLLPPNDVPNLDVERDEDRLVIKRSDVDNMSIVVKWAPPDAIDLVLVKDQARLPTRFTLSKATQTWSSPDGDLFRAVRAAIIGLYPQVDGKVKL